MFSMSVSFQKDKARLVCFKHKRLENFTDFYPERYRSFLFGTGGTLLG